MPDHRPRIGHPLPVGAACDEGLQRRIVSDDQMAVSGDLQIDLEIVDAMRQRRGEGRQGVIRRQDASAAMARFDACFPYFFKLICEENLPGNST